MIILDTNVLSEPTRPHPAEAVLAWASDIPSAELFTTVISQAEMLVGLEIMPHGRRRSILAERIGQIFAIDFAGRVLPFEGTAARALSILPLRRGRSGKPVIDSDALIAAIASANNAVVATRDIGGFRHYGIPLLNPWTGEKA
jgi:toxin FitB